MVAPMRPLPLSLDQQEAFERDGFVGPIDVLSATEVVALRSAVAEVIDNLDRHRYDSPHVDDDLRVFIRSERDRCAAANQFRLAREYRISACSEPDEFCRLVRRKNSSGSQIGRAHV